MNKISGRQRALYCRSEERSDEESRQELKLWSNSEYNLKARSRTRRARASRSFASPSGGCFAALRMTLAVLAGLILLLQSADIFSSNIWAAESSVDMPFPMGETITYDIKKFKFKVGEATLVFGGLVDFSGREALLITFTAKGFRFSDQERIYLDPETFYPIVIERDLNIFGLKEKIVEFYDTKYGKVRVVKTARGRQKEQIIQRGERFDNIYGFIYRYRQRGQFVKGENLELHLPTRDVSFKLDKKSKFMAAGQEFDAYYMSSVSKKYKVWFDSSQKKIPLMIDGAVGFGQTSMIMKEYDDNGKQ